MQPTSEVRWLFHDDTPEKPGGVYLQQKMRDPPNADMWVDVPCVDDNDNLVTDSWATAMNRTKG